MDDASPIAPHPVERIIRLEEKSDVVEARLSRIEDKLDQILQRLAETPTRIDLLGAFVAALAVLGIVFAGLGWLETRSSRLQPTAASAPVVIQLPAYLTTPPLIPRPLAR